MNLAIILGLDQYKNLTDLPACKNDVNIIHDLLSATKKYDSILCINQETTSNSVKEKITEFIKQYKGQPIKEVFFYYTGHGAYINGDFFYAMADYDSKRINQTSLQNSELDNWFRSLEPELMIKVIDACQAGVPYVKENNLLDKYIRETGATFKKCYFMFSSTIEQSSYQDDELSYFTKSFIRSIQNYGRKSLRYKDIIDFISDDFENNTEQTPLFVVQADYIDKFCDVNAEIIQAIALKILGDTENLVGKDEQEGITLEDLIKKEALEYCTEEEVMERLEAIKKMFESFEYPKELFKLYNMEIDISLDCDDIPKGRLIGKWLNENKNNYFAKSKTKRESYETEIEVPQKGLFKFSGLTTTKTVTKYRDVIEGFILTTEVPFHCIQIDANPLYENIIPYYFMLTFVFSKTEIRLFYCYSKYKEINWKETELDKEFEWKTYSVKLKNLEELLGETENIIKGFCSLIINELRTRYNFQKETTK